MKFLVFTVYDQAAKAYLPPFFLPTVGMAVRAFTDCVNDANHSFGRHPKDYTLFQAGTFDDNSGAFAIDSTLLSVVNGVQVKDSDPVAAQQAFDLASGVKVQATKE